MFRWTMLDFGFVKLLQHRFQPLAYDKDPHDHPRSFLTLVVRGGYDDVQPCSCDAHARDRAAMLACSATKIDQVRAPAIRFRRAEHAHITTGGPKGALTFVVMGPLRREWGFWRDGRLWPWREYERRFGINFRCDE